MFSLAGVVALLGMDLEGGRASAANAVVDKDIDALGESLGVSLNEELQDGVQSHTAIRASIGSSSLNVSKRRHRVVGRTLPIG